MLHGAIGIRQAIADRMFAREKRDHGRSWHVRAQVDHEVTKVVLFFRADGAVREEYVRAAAREAAYCVIRVNPRIHARGRFELRARWPELRRYYGRSGQQRFEERSQSDQYTERCMHGRSGPPRSRADVLRLA
jgi:hypothetical protein